MNILTTIGFVLGAGVIATDHLLFRLPHWLAIVLYTAAVVLMIAGMIICRKMRS